MEFPDSIEKPQAGALDISVVTAELGARATETLLLRAYAQQLSAAFDEQQKIIAELRAALTKHGVATDIRFVPSEPKRAADYVPSFAGFNAVTDNSLMEGTG